MYDTNHLQSRNIPNFVHMCFTRSACNSWWTFGSRNSDLARTWLAKVGNTSVEYGCGALDPLPSDCSKSVQRWAYVFRSSSTIILCNMMHDLMMTPKSAMSHKRVGSRCWSKNLFDKCFNDNKPRGINDKFYEWWSTDVCTWVFVKKNRNHISG